MLPHDDKARRCWAHCACLAVAFAAVVLAAFTLSRGSARSSACVQVVVSEAVHGRRGLRMNSHTKLHASCAWRMRSLLGCAHSHPCPALAWRCAVQAHNPVDATVMPLPTPKRRRVCRKAAATPSEPLVPQRMEATAQQSEEDATAQSKLLNSKALQGTAQCRLWEAVLKAVRERENVVSFFDVASLTPRGGPQA